MKVGIVGLPQTGKKTLFQLLVGRGLSEKDLAGNEAIKGISEIKDPRFDNLVAMYKPRSAVRARIEMELLPKLDKENLSGGKVFKNIANVDVICHVVRAFQDDSVYHVKGSVDPRRDIDDVHAEFIMQDIMFIEQRIERIEKNTKRSKDETLEKEKETLIRLKSELDIGRPLQMVPLKPEEEKILSGYPLVTRKAEVIVLNVSECDKMASDLMASLKKDHGVVNVHVACVPVKIESEIASFESQNEKEEFLNALGIKEPASDVLTCVCLRALNLSSFFTVGTDEVRQWNIRTGSSVLKAAGAIHTDMERGFIRGEVIKYDDLMRLGSEEKVKEAGKCYLRGRDYIVEDGDILDIRFNV